MTWPGWRVRITLADNCHAYDVRDQPMTRLELVELAAVAVRLGIVAGRGWWWGARSLASVGAFLLFDLVGISDK